MAWRHAFIAITVRVGNADDMHLANGARTVLANALSDLWSDKRMGSVLIDAARTLHACLPWGGLEGDSDKTVLCAEGSSDIARAA